uniref:Cyclin C-terminal domain-containing protein n=1 Tax=Zooxanthella nutricula TaxID=1333877 RepID=A0A7S2JEF2_9DINO|mmetsp:Transcript_29319/g.88713  ORF Transcript_29319/g.88713 Transcript_29319/m.88713 type:complete len:408 (+) Transcript_29319:120-1343(+)
MIASRVVGSLIAFAAAAFAARTRTRAAVGGGSLARAGSTARVDGGCPSGFSCCALMPDDMVPVCVDSTSIAAKVKGEPTSDCAAFFLNSPLDRVTGRGQWSAATRPMRCRATSRFFRSVSPIDDAGNATQFLDLTQLSEDDDETLENFLATQANWMPQEVGDVTVRDEAVTTLLVDSQLVGLSEATLYLAVTILDWYISDAAVQAEDYLRVGFAALCLAARTQPKIKVDKILGGIDSGLWKYLVDQNDARGKSNMAFILESSEKLEVTILEAMHAKSKYVSPTAMDFLGILERPNWGAAGDKEASNELAHHIANLALESGETRLERPVVIASAALYLSNDYCERQDKWPPWMEHISTVERGEALRVAEKLRRLIEFHEEHRGSFASFARLQTKRQWRKINNYAADAP